MKLKTISVCFLLISCGFDRTPRTMDRMADTTEKMAITTDKGMTDMNEKFEKMLDQMNALTESLAQFASVTPELKKLLINTNEMISLLDDDAKKLIAQIMNDLAETTPEMKSIFQKTNQLLNSIDEDTKIKLSNMFEDFMLLAPEMKSLFKNANEILESVDEETKAKLKKMLDGAADLLSSFSNFSGKDDEEKKVETTNEEFFESLK